MPGYRLLAGALGIHAHRPGDRLHKAGAGHHRGQVGHHPQPRCVEALGTHVDAHQPVGFPRLEGLHVLRSGVVLGMHQQHPVALLLQQPAEAAGMGDVAGHHQSAGFRVLAPHHLQPLPRVEQKAQGNAAAVAEADRPAQVAGTPAFALLLGER